ncbi:MAG: hydrogenase formation protein HypD [Bdellovibrionales bacterium]|jgi:hydrogenase expression/formation protein HypD|nr:hydrogenase formation protein HypD [Bdellovibrionales bacterium]MBT3526149.1 hydrogenase formation protein HypD [Bdellovibrionales bacterium]MBT7668840.1 hydrogenase formation protein HypD [Bdellovibrionales bacterium]
MMNDQILKKLSVLRKSIREISHQDISLMEVCGTHTMSIAQHGIRSMLPKNIKIIGGPGCPVCVTSQSDIQMAIDLAQRENFIIATFGDMLKVPSQGDYLSNYPNVKMLYSPLDSLKMAQENPDQEIVLLGIGFETTTPLIAATILKAQEQEIKNFSVLSMQKAIPVAMTAILQDPECRVDGLILPGHVSSIVGKNYYKFLDPLKIPSVISDFRPLGIMESIFLLTKYINQGVYQVTNNYPAVVSDEGNQEALRILFEVYQDCDAGWRGIGVIPKSAHGIKDKYSQFDAAKKFDLTFQDIPEPPGCRCGEILMGKAGPTDCGLFANKCTPLNPIGPCMVSAEGTCAAFYKYQPVLEQ